ncbi:MAG TPA: histidine kinase N-terminal 7TM domain-containing protein, partial [Armatimonadota bacterium]
MSSFPFNLLTLVVSMLITAILAILGMYRRVPGARTFSLLMWSFTVWTLTNTLCMLAHTLPIALLWDRIAYVAIDVSVIGWMVFAGQYTGNGRWFTPRNIAFFAIVPVIAFVLTWTNQWHGLYYNSARLELLGDTSLLQISGGPVYWLHMIYLFGVSTIGIALLVQAYARSSTLYRGQFIVLFTAVLIPWVTYILGYVGGNALLNCNDITTLTFPFSGLVVFWGITRYKLLEVAPIARYAVLEGLLDGVIALDADARVVDANPAAQRIIGKPLKTLIGALLAESWARGAELLGQASDQEDVLEFSTPDKHWYEIRISPLRNWREEHVGRLVVLHDITDLKCSEIERARLEEQLRQAQKMEAIGLLAGGIAHDFNNLLTPIIGYAEILQLRLRQEETLARYAGSIMEAAQRAASITKQLKVFSRKQVLTLQEITLERVIRDFMPIVHSIVGETITIEASLQSDTGRVKVDPGQIQQVLMNLAMNARDAMPHGGMLTIELASAEPDALDHHASPALATGPCSALTVRDTGEGMTTETLERIFEPFFTTKERGKGTGLGMSVVFGIIKQHQGHITVDSTPGVGTTVRIILPCVEEHAQQTVSEASSVDISEATIL